MFFALIYAIFSLPYFGHDAFMHHALHCIFVLLHKKLVVKPQHDNKSQYTMLQL